MTFEQWCKGEGFDVLSLNTASRASLMKAYRADMEEGPDAPSDSDEVDAADGEGTARFLTPMRRGGHDAAS